MGLTINSIKQMIQMGLCDADIQAFIDGWALCPTCDTKKAKISPPSQTLPSLTYEELKYVNGGGDSKIGGAGGKKERGGVTQRGCRLPEDFDLTPEMWEWATRETNCSEVWVSRESENFVDYWRAASGRTATKRDWVAAWRNWIRKAADLHERSQKIYSTDGKVQRR